MKTFDILKYIIYHYGQGDLILYLLVRANVFVTGKTGRWSFGCHNLASKNIRNHRYKDILMVGTFTTVGVSLLLY